MSQSPALRRWIGKAGLAVLSSMALAGGALSVSAAAQAATPGGNPFTPSYNHPYRHGAVPTREANSQIKAYAAAHPNAIQPNSANNLVFRGGVDGIGVTIGAPKVYLIFWGSTWGTQSTDANGNMTFSGDTKGGAPRLQMMFKGLGTGGELWSGIATQYCEGVATGTQICGTAGTHVGYPTGGNLAGVWYDNSAVANTTNGHQIAVEGVAAASHFGNTTAALNRSAQYVILSPTGTHPDGFNTTGANWCAWHDWNGDTTLTGGSATSTVGDVAFSNMPYVMDMGTSCGQSFVNAGTAGTLDGYTMVEGHEYMETITDQNPAGGYTDSAGAENGDKCAWVATTAQGGAANVAMGNGSYAEQGGWSNDSVGGTGQCEISHAIVGGGGSTGPTVTNPGNQTGTVGTAASLTVTASGGTTPYTWSATGLPPGKTINASTGVISGTPTTAGTYSTTVTATDAAAKAGSASFSWTINPSGGGGCTGAGQKLANPGFESGAVSWSQTAGVIGANGPSEPAHTGTWDAWLNGYGTTHTDTLSQAVALPAGCTTYTFSFWLHIDTAETTTTTAYDTVKVQVLNSAGTVLATLATYSNLNHNTGYAQKSFSLAAYAGQTVTLKFTGTEDTSLQTSFVVDDTAVNVS
jgi:hypothetical protein